MISEDDLQRRSNEPRGSRRREAEKWTMRWRHGCYVSSHTKGRRTVLARRGDISPTSGPRQGLGIGMPESTLIWSAYFHYKMVDGYQHNDYVDVFVYSDLPVDLVRHGTHSHLHLKPFRIIAIGYHKWCHLTGLQHNMVAMHDCFLLNANRYLYITVSYKQILLLLFTRLIQVQLDKWWVRLYPLLATAFMQSYFEL